MRVWVWVRVLVWVRVCVEVWVRVRVRIRMRVRAAKINAAVSHIVLFRVICQSLVRASTSPRCVHGRQRLPGHEPVHVAKHHKHVRRHRVVLVVAV